MVITTHPSGKMSVDKAFNASFNELLTLNKTIKKDEAASAVSTDGWAFEQLIQSGHFGDYCGYVIKATSRGELTTLSARGIVGPGGVMVYAQKFWAVIYKTQDSSFQLIDARTDAKTADVANFHACLPTQTLFTDSARFCGCCPDSYAFVNGYLFERYASSVSFAAYPSFEYGTLVGGRLTSAYGIHTGTWGFDFLPTTAAGLRRSLLNHYRNRPATMKLAANEGFCITDSTIMDLIVNNVKRGASIKQQLPYIQVYEKPVSGAYGTSGVVWLGVTPTLNTYKKYADQIAYVGISTANNINPLVLALFNQTVETAILYADYIFVRDTILDTILQDYSTLYQRLLKEQVVACQSTVDAAIKNFEDVIKQLQKESLSVKNVASSRNNLISASGVFELDLPGVPARKVLSSVSDLVSALSTLTSETKNWIKPLSQFSDEEKDALVQLGFKAEAKYPSLTLMADVSGMRKAFKAKHKKAQETLDLLVDSMNTGLSYESYAAGMTPIPDGFITKDPSGKWNSSYQYTDGNHCSNKEGRSFAWMGPSSSAYISNGDKLQAWLLQGFAPIDGIMRTGGRRTAFDEQYIESFTVSHGVDFSTLTMRIRTNYFSCKLGGRCQVPDQTMSRHLINAWLAHFLDGKIYGGANIEAAANVVFKGYDYDYAPKTGLVLEATRKDFSKGTGCSYHDDMAYDSHYIASQCWGEAADIGDRYAFVPPMVWEISVPLQKGIIPSVGIGESGQIHDLAAKIEADLQVMLGDVNSQCVEWLISSLRNAGILGEVKLCGKTSAQFVTPQTLACVTDFSLSNIAELKRIIDDCITSKAPADSIPVFSGDELAALKQLSKDIEDLAALSSDKVWFDGGFTPVAKGQNPELLGWYLHQ